eukprot:1039985-Pyramimonas_sp.AAC.1
MALEGVIDLEKELELEDSEVDEAARQEVAEAKRKVLADLQQGAKEYANQLQEHIRRAKEMAASNKETIRQEAKKRK